nr:hypothetical protein [Tanacetum cinerariifolium]
LEGFALTERNTLRAADLVDQPVGGDEHQASRLHLHATDRPLVIEVAVDIPHAHALAGNGLELFGVGMQHMQRHTRARKTEHLSGVIEPEKGGIQTVVGLWGAIKAVHLPQLLLDAAVDRRQQARRVARPQLCQRLGQG